MELYRINIKELRKRDMINILGDYKNMRGTDKTFINDMKKMIYCK